MRQAQLGHLMESAKSTGQDIARFAGRGDKNLAVREGASR